MRVVSLFDGVSCARVALNRAGIPVTVYFASEIDKNAIKVAQKNYPDTIQLGSVVGLVPPECDLLIGGSPCQDLSIAKKDRKGLDGNRSGLFWEWVRVWKETKPKWWVLENVASMPKKDRDIITATLGVEPVMFNASLVSAQCRKRLFWTNIKFDLPTDRGILLKDILEAEVDERFYIKKEFTKTAQTGRNETKKLGYMGKKDHQSKRVYDDGGKLPTLTVDCNSMVKVGRDIGRRLNADGHRADADTTIPYERRIETREDGKCGTLTNVQKDNLVVSNVVRKLTPIECERLQSLPDNYTKDVATTNRYKCLGNAFNVEVVAHILRHINPPAPSLSCGQHESSP
jgi:DNA-cytosine methyltransferase